MLINAIDAICNNTVLDLASDTFDTKLIDMDNEYLLDIIIGNTGQLTNKLFINASDGTFHNVVDLPSKLATLYNIYFINRNNYLNSNHNHYLNDFHHDHFHLFILFFVFLDLDIFRLIAHLCLLRMITTDPLPHFTYPT